MHQRSEAELQQSDARLSEAESLILSIAAELQDSAVDCLIVVLQQLNVKGELSPDLRDRAANLALRDVRNEISHPAVGNPKSMVRELQRLIVQVCLGPALDEGTEELLAFAARVCAHPKGCRAGGDAAVTAPSTESVKPLK